jgi:hypothetical protein
MRSSFQIRPRVVASTSLLTAITAGAWAGCGSSSSGFPAGAIASQGSPDSGDDSTTTNCFGDCSNSGSSSRFTGSSSSDGGPVTPTPVDANIVTSECPGPLTSAMFAALQSASANSAALKWLYPYDGTVFPGGLAGPVLQWSQTGAPDGVYIHLHSDRFDFKGCYKGSGATNLPLDDVTWATAFAQTGGKTDPLTVELSTIRGGSASGMITERWIFARGSLAGDVYYNTYGSKLVPGQTNQNGAVMRIDHGKAQAFLYTTNGVTPFGPCISCHSLSASGSILAAQQHFYPGSDPLNGKGSMSFDLTRTPNPNPMTPTASDIKDDWGLSAVYPDGTLLLTSGEPGNTAATPIFPGAAGNNTAMIGPKAATMYNTSTGSPISFTGLTTPYAMMPMFSTDGKSIVYTETPAFDAGAEGHTLIVMDFDVGSKVFSNPRRIFHDDTKFPGWPFFTPDGKEVIFSLGNTNNFASELAPAGDIVFAAQLYVTDVASGLTHRLDGASGYDSKGAEFLPFPGRDENLDFYPTVAPIAAGGYFWAYFTSRRSYGNLYPGKNGMGAKDVGTKAIWASAIDIDAPAGTDPSHPAFYFPGQELGSGNIRAFAVLAPCKANGADCETGLDCCDGSCTMGKCGIPNTCAGTNDRCTATVKCCNAADQCLGGYCGFIEK